MCYWAKTAGISPINQRTNMWCIVQNHSSGKSLPHSNIPNYFSRAVFRNVLSFATLFDLREFQAIGCRDEHFFRWYEAKA